MPNIKILKKTLVVDFDGVINQYISGWQGFGIISDPPVTGAIEFLYKASMEFNVCIYSSRSKSLRGRWAMKQWLKRHVEEFFGGACLESDDLLCEIKWPWFKPAAWLTIDDRAFMFLGEFPTLNYIKRFRPWNK